MCMHVCMYMYVYVCMLVCYITYIYWAVYLSWFIFMPFQLGVSTDSRESAKSTPEWTVTDTNHSTECAPSNVGVVETVSTRRKEIFYLRLYGIRHMVKDHSDSERGNPLPPHSLCYTSRGALAGMRNSSMKDWSDNPSYHERTLLPRSYNYRTGRNVLFNDALNTFYLWLYGVRHMVKDHSDSEKGNPLPLHGPLFPINSKGSIRRPIAPWANALTTEQHLTLLLKERGTL